MVIILILFYYQARASRARTQAPIVHSKQHNSIQAHVPTQGKTSRNASQASVETARNNGLSSKTLDALPHRDVHSEPQFQAVCNAHKETRETDGSLFQAKGWQPLGLSRPRAGRVSPRTTQTRRTSGTGSSASSEDEPVETDESSASSAPPRRARPPLTRRTNSSATNVRIWTRAYTYGSVCCS